MSNIQPRVSIGLPVYQGENFISQALDSLLSQTFEDFEIIISDNASTDKTEEICRAYALKDQRIRYYRNQQNLGAGWNYNRVFQLSRGKYFKWAAHDDLCTPDFLEKCVEVLERDSSVILCHPRTRIIDEQGKFLEGSDERYVTLTNANIKLNTDSSLPQQRFRDLLCFPHSCYQVFGLIRKSILEKTPLIDRYAGSDRVLLARLALHGKFYEIPEYLFFLRRHSGQSINLCARSVYLYTFWFDPSSKGKVIFPRWRRLRENFKSIQQAPLTWQQHIACYLCMLQWLLQGAWLGMLKDLIVAAIQILDNFYTSLNRRHQSHRDASSKGNFILNKIPKLDTTPDQHLS